MKKYLISLSRSRKRQILIFADFCTISLSLWISLMIRQDNYFTFSEGYELTGATSDDLYLLLLLAIVSIIPVLIITRLYRSITRYINIETYVKITKASVIGSAIWAFIILTLHIPVPRSVLIIFFVLSTLLLYMTRYIARALLTHQRINNMRKVLI